MYSELPPSEKEAWVARAEADKARYLHELAGYVPPPGYDSKGDAIVNLVATKGGRKGKPEKDINAPKRNVCSTRVIIVLSFCFSIGWIMSHLTNCLIFGCDPQMSAYLLYQKAMREQFKRENPGMVCTSRLFFPVPYSVVND